MMGDVLIFTALASPIDIKKLIGEIPVLWSEQMEVYGFGTSY